MLFTCCLISREPKRGKGKDKDRDHNSENSRLNSPGRAEVETQTGVEQTQVSKKWIPGILKNPSDRNRDPNRRNACTQTPRNKRRTEASPSVPERSLFPESESEDEAALNHLRHWTTPPSHNNFQPSVTHQHLGILNSSMSMSKVPLPRNIKILMTEDGPTRPLRRHDRVVWIDPDGNPEHGVVKWLGSIAGQECAGLKLDSGRKVSFGDESGAKLYSNKSGARATVPIYRLLLETDYAAYSGIRFECTPTQNQFIIPQSTFIPKKRRSLEPGIELITPIRKVGLEGGCDMEMGTEGTGLDLKCWAAGAQVYIRETREMVEILNRRLRGKHLLVKVIYLDQSDTPGRVVEMYLSRLMSIGYLVEKDPTASPIQIPCGKETIYTGNDYIQSPSKELQRTETATTPTPSAPAARVSTPEKMKMGDKNYHEFHAYPPSKRIKDMGSLFLELQSLGLSSPRDKSAELNTWAQHGAKFSPGKPPIPWGHRKEDWEDEDNSLEAETDNVCTENEFNLRREEHRYEAEVSSPQLAVTLKPTPEREFPKRVSIDEPDRAAVVGVRQVVLALEAKGLDLNGRSRNSLILQ